MTLKEAIKPMGDYTRVKVIQLGTTRECEIFEGKEWDCNNCKQKCGGEYLYNKQDEWCNYKGDSGEIPIKFADYIVEKIEICEDYSGMYARKKVKKETFILIQINELKGDEDY